MSDHLEAYQKRKDTNKAKVSGIKGIFLIDLKGSKKQVAVIYNGKGKIIGSLCAYCYGRTKLDPWRNGQYVFSYCSLCYIDMAIIEDSFSSGKKSMKVRRKMLDPNQVKIDWTKFEGWVDKGQAKLVFMASKYKIYPKELKEKLVDHYGDRIEFKRGRGGGITLTPLSKETRKQNDKVKRLRNQATN